MRALAFGAVAALLSGTAAVAQTPCPGNPKPLGVSRTVQIDTAGGPGFGTEHFKQHDFLQPGEVVLTFDDGPWQSTTPLVLKALAAECVKATFFPIGKHATYYPDVLKQVAAAGHTVGSHTWSHVDLSKKTDSEAREEIEKGISAARLTTDGAAAPLFRFPALRHPPAAVSYLGERNVGIFSTDMDSFDFKMRKPEQIVKSVVDKLKKNGKGIVLLHDFMQSTAQAMPALLRELKAGGYRIVHVTTKAPATSLAAYDQIVLRDMPGAVAATSVRPAPSVVATVTPAAPAPSPPVAAPAGAARRIALVIGNSSYRAVPMLPNPRNDAATVARTLETVGFQAVTLKLDLAKEELVRALRDFAREADRADWALVYFAGHGIELGSDASGSNYLIPVDAKLESDRDIEFETVPLRQVMTAVEGAKKLRLIILDACRDNLFARQMQRTVASRSIGRGLARIEPSGGVLVAYAAKHGEIALDGSGGNSPFVTALASRLPQPGLEIGKLFRLVRDDVLAVTGQKQEPFVYGSLPGEDFYFVAAK